MWTRLAFWILSSSVLFGALPESVTFVGRTEFDRLVEQGKKEQWSRLPLGERTAAVGMALRGVPYQNFTLELHERHEAPSVNMQGMDCWTFFEIALGTARAFSFRERPGHRDLLAMIELERYRGGRCTGCFSSRLHHLEDWVYDNQKRGLVQDITPTLPGSRTMKRNIAYMGKNWKSFRQLRANPSLVPKFQKLEKDLSTRGISYIPKSEVRAVEKYLRDGDVISIVTTWPETYTSHVGLAVRDRSGRARFLHASRDERKVILDSPITDYLARYSKHAGIMVARPMDLPRRMADQFRRRTPDQG
jgi:hypothetical protein